MIPYLSYMTHVGYNWCQLCGLLNRPSSQGTCSFQLNNGTRCDRSRNSGTCSLLWPIRSSVRRDCYTNLECLVFMHPCLPFTLLTQKYLT